MQKTFRKSNRKVVTPSMFVKNAQGIGCLPIEVNKYYEPQILERDG